MRIGLVLNVLDEEYQISVYRGIKNQALKKGVDLICFQNENAKSSDDSIFFNYAKKDYFNLDGIILLTSVLIDSNELSTKQDIEKIWGNIPVVSVGQKIQGVPSFLIQTDDSMKQLVEHLILKHNYRKFLFIGGPQNHHDAIMRENIFTKTMEAYKPWFSDLSYKVRHGMFTEQAAVQVMDDFYKENPNASLDAIVCANDNMALGVYKFFKMNQENSKIKECAVTGFDDIPQAKFEIPSLTTIKQPLQEIGTVAFDSLVEMINGSKISDEVFVESEFIVRDSCGCNLSRKKQNWQEEFISQLQTKYVQTEHFLRLVSHISMDLNYPETLLGLKYQLNISVEQLGVSDFCVLLGNKNLKPIYVRIDNVYYPEFNDNKECTIGEFYEKILQLKKSKSSSLIFKNLYSGNQILGIVFYDGSHNVLSHLCNVSINVAHALLRIENSQEKKRREEYLTKEVSKRTKELIEANNKRMEVEAEVLKISEMERMRFSTDLHDDICQRLAGISMLCRSYANSNVPTEKSKMEELASLIGDTLQRTRQYAHNSYPVELESLGLKDSIANLCNSFEQQQNIKCTYIWEISDKTEFNNIQKLNIFRIIQESLHNVGKHSKAKNVKVSLIQKNKNVNIEICDDGVGIPEKKSVKKGLGLNSMIYRADQMKATFRIEKNIPCGTCVKLNLDL